MSDIARLEALQRGEPRAFEEIYRLHAPALRRLLSRQLRTCGVRDGTSPCPDLEDLIHEAFIRAFGSSARRTYDPSRRYEPFLAAIARNVVRDHLRRARLERRSLRSLARSDGELPQRDAPHSLQSPHSLDILAMRRLREAMRSLSTRQKELLHVRFYEETSQRQAAKLMGFSYQEIRTLELKLWRQLRSFVTIGMHRETALS